MDIFNIRGFDGAGIDRQRLADLRALLEQRRGGRAGVDENGQMWPIADVVRGDRADGEVM